MRREFVWLGFAVLMLLRLAFAMAGESDQANTDCGCLALYQLLQIEGRPVPLEKIRARLGPSVSGGYSMMQVRDVAANFGLKLTGVQLARSAKALDRPMMVYLARGPHGHFNLVRPVGHSGTLTQIIDPNHPPTVRDTTDLIGSGEWTGLALIPTRSRGTVSLALLALGGMSLLSVGWWFWNGLRRSGRWTPRKYRALATD